MRIKALEGGKLGAVREAEIRKECRATSRFGEGERPGVRNEAPASAAAAAAFMVQLGA